MNRTIFTLIFLLACALGVFAQAPPGGGGGGPNPPPGYFVLDENWWYTIEFDGKIDYVGQRYDQSGNIVTWNHTVTWPFNDGTIASNSTSQPGIASVESRGTITFKVKWKHALITPPNSMRINAAAPIRGGISATGELDLSNGLGTEAVNGGWVPGLPNYQNKWCPGVFLRKIKIDANGEGEFTVSQFAYAETQTAMSSCQVEAPTLAVASDPRDVEITGIDSVWPNRKSSITDPHSKNFPLPQDDYPYFGGLNGYIVARTFNYVSHRVEPSPIYYTTDATDWAQWHIGIAPNKFTVPDYAMETFNSTSYRVVAYPASIVGGVAGDAYVWKSYDYTSGGFSNGPTTRNGIYDPQYASEASSQRGVYQRAAAIEVTRVGHPSTGVFRDGDEGQTDNVSLKWTFAEDGLVAESQRTVVLHLNEEPDGQVSDEWVDLNLEKGYEESNFTPETNGWASGDGVTITKKPSYGENVKAIAGLLGTLGYAGEVAIIALGVHGAALEIAFGAMLFAHSVLELALEEEHGWDFHRTDYTDPARCDWLVVEAGIAVPGYGVVDECHYDEPAKLAAFRSAFQNAINNADWAYWRMEHRLKSAFKIEMVDVYDLTGYVGLQARDHRHDLEGASAFHRVTFSKTAHSYGSP